jgi:hypothetical protein
MKDLLKLVLCWIAFVVAIFASGAITQILRLKAIQIPPGISPQSMLVAQLLGGAVLVVGLYPIARGLAARPLLRFAVIAGFILLALGVNGFIEARVFTHFVDGRMGSATVFYLVLAAALGSAVGFSFGAPGIRTGFAPHNLPGWLGRMAAAWLAWPVIYFFFGMSIAPIVVPYYKAGIAGLQLPSSMATIFEVQLVRSVIFLACSLPFVALWKGSRRGLWLALGMAHAFTVGLYGLVSAAFLPAILRIVHAVEMTCDSFAYAGLLVLLFGAVCEKTSASPAPAPIEHLSAHAAR